MVASLLRAPEEPVVLSTETPGSLQIGSLGREKLFCFVNEGFPWFSFSLGGSAGSGTDAGGADVDTDVAVAFAVIAL